jgi:hypothetical protein
MKRLVLVLGLAVLGWLGRRQLRSYGDAQRYLTLLALLQIIAVMGKTSASAKSVSTENRLNTVVLPALGSLNAAIPANSAFLSTLSHTFAPALGSSGFGGGVWTAAQQTALLSLQGVINTVINAGVTVGIWS